MDVLKLFFRLLGLILFCLTLNGCLFSYLVDSGYNQYKLLRSGKPIENVLKRDDLDPNIKRKLQLTLDVRKFLTENLKLKNTKNYQNFVELKRPFVTYIVTVAHYEKLEPKLFWYPLVGHLPYKGYFSKEKAEQEAKSYDPEKFDTMVRGVSAYSTLGWFNDPLLSSMTRGEDYHLVNTIIHESTHATLFINSQADFNERLATYVGNIGTELYFEKIEGPNSPTLKKIREDNEDEVIFSKFISEEIKILREWYKSNPADLDIVRAKKLKDIQIRFKNDIQVKLKTKNYANFADSKLNNAILLYLDTYMTDLSLFDKLFEHFNKDFAAFLTFCKSLEKNSDPNQAVKTFLYSSHSGESNP